jgi:hypothetical protein
MFKLVEKTTYGKLGLFVFPGIMIAIVSGWAYAPYYFAAFICYALLMIYNESKGKEESILFSLVGLLLIGFYIYIMVEYDIVKEIGGYYYAGFFNGASRLLSYASAAFGALITLVKIVTYIGGNAGTNKAIMNENKEDNTTLINTIQPRGRETNWAERTFIVEEGRDTRKD